MNDDNDRLNKYIDMIVSASMGIWDVFITVLFILGVIAAIVYFAR